jgi:hypothetical protein
VRTRLQTSAAAPLPVLGRCASCAPGRLAIEFSGCSPQVAAVGGPVVPSLRRSIVPAASAGPRPSRTRSLREPDTSITAQGSAPTEGTGEEQRHGVHGWPA